MGMIGIVGLIGLIIWKLGRSYAVTMIFTLCHRELSIPYIQRKHNLWAFL
jgi:hypothetical protein